MAVQAVQLLAITLASFRFLFYSGAAVLGGLVGSEVLISAELASAFRIGIPPPGSARGAAVNLLAVMFLVRLAQVRRRRQTTV
jgi:hypothetical protein